MDNPTPNPTLLNEPMRTALTEALERLATLFWGPTPEVCQQMKDGAFWEPFETLAPFLAALRIVG